MSRVSHRGDNVEKREVRFLPAAQLEHLFTEVSGVGYAIIGPQVVDGAVVYRTISGSDQLPVGIQDQQRPGAYRLTTNNSERRFDWSVGVSGIKAQLLPPEQPLWRSERGEDGSLHFKGMDDHAAVAIFGLRSCDLHAIRLMDRHFLRTGGEHPSYRQRNGKRLLIVVSCARSAPTCFCVSARTGPEPQDDYDLRLDELEGGFLLRAGSDEGSAVIAALDLAEATSEQLELADRQIHDAAEQQQRALGTGDFRYVLQGREESAYWQQVADRCLACGNCTALCPTCFCHREEEVASLEISHSIHQRVWDSCFSDAHSQLHGIPIRSGRKERYRQWLTHKLAGWHGQFGESGCVGCGRCITWCPVGIDLVAEANRFLAGEHDG